MFPQRIVVEDDEIVVHCLGVVMDADYNDPNYVFVMPTHWARQTGDLEWQLIADMHLYRARQSDLINVRLPGHITHPEFDARIFANAVRELAPHLVTDLANAFKRPDGSLDFFVRYLTDHDPLIE